MSVADVVRRSCWLVVVAAATSTIVATRGDAQIPERFTNLKVLPDTTSRAGLVAQMRQFSFALGVRCSFCHAVSDGLGEPTDDFAADTKPTKLRAREMMRMVKDLNEVYLARLPERRTPNVGVECATCHGGIPRPEQLRNLLHRLTTARGVDTAMSTYDALRQRFYGRKAYDFGPRSMIQLGEQLAGEARHADAIVVFRKALATDSNSTEVLMLLGAEHAAVADTTEAIRAYQRVVQLDSAGFFGRTAAQRIAALRRPH